MTLSGLASEAKPMRTADFNFAFPENQIAMVPLPRGEARLMVVPRQIPLPSDFVLPVEPQGWAFGHARDITRILKSGDALALNDTKVLRARLHGQLPNGSACEVFLLKAILSDANTSMWECLAKPGRKLLPGIRVNFAPDFFGEVVEARPDGARVVRFNLAPQAFFNALETVGSIPLPPYIRRPVEAEDANAYQSVFAENPGSVAAPTASLHWSDAMLAQVRQNGVSLAKLTLHVGAGTFRPVQTELAEDHPMHSERYFFSGSSADLLNATRKTGGRVLAVGTTSARVLESCCDDAGLFHPNHGETNLFVRPGYQWKGVDALWTNFHWPKSTLFMLVCGMLGVERAQAAYAEAMRRGFRLFSYGDAMLIL